MVAIGDRIRTILERCLPQRESPLVLAHVLELLRKRGPQARSRHLGVILVMDERIAILFDRKFCLIELSWLIANLSRDHGCPKKAVNCGVFRQRGAKICRTAGSCGRGEESVGYADFFLLAQDAIQRWVPSSGGDAASMILAMSSALMPRSSISRCFISASIRRR